MPIVNKILSTLRKYLTTHLEVDTIFHVNYRNDCIQRPPSIVGTFEGIVITGQGSIVQSIVAA